MDPIQAFREHVIRGIDNSMPLLSKPPGINLSKTPQFGLD